MKRHLYAAAAAYPILLLGTLALAASARANDTPRQMDVSRRGADVMPFSLAATTHVFSKTADGGIQQVVTKTHDPKQVTLIREHLSAIAQRFSAGDFGAPGQIHGADMPGLAALRAAKPGELDIRYRDLPNGGEIAYRSKQGRLVAALHQWFDAQLSDHGHDATDKQDAGMTHHHSMDMPTK